MKKIMFNDRFDLTDAVLEGIKTMTRRFVPTKEAKWLDLFYDSDNWDYAKQMCINDSAAYKIGEVVAVAQPYKDIDKNFLQEQCWANEEPLGYRENEAGWNNKMFVTSYYMPHQIRITDIKVERLQDISDEDCMKEGVLWDYDDYPDMSRKVYLINDYEAFPTPRVAFANLINRVCGKSTWEINPYVFVYSFELVK